MAFAALSALVPRMASAQGSVPLLNQPLVGCYDVEVIGVGLYNDTPPVGITTAVQIPPPGGTVVAAYIEWVGAEDTTPGGSQLDGTSTLTLNNVAVNGTLAESLDLNGNAGYDPRAHVSAGPPGWFSWYANIGPSGLGIIPAQISTPFTLTIGGWDSPAKQTNGATISLVYENGPCSTTNDIQFLTGVNWYHYHAGLHQFSDLLVYPVKPEPIDRIVRMYLSHAGTDKSQTACRGGAVWMVADDGSRPQPQARDFDLVAVGDNDGDGVARGYGINGGVEILNDPFTSAALPCTPTLNAAPDEPYASGHPYAGGAAAAPYRAISIDPPDGGDVGAPGEWGVLAARVLIPAHARWVAFQLESEPDQNGESGSWVGGGVFLIVPTATIGDRVWHDGNGNGRQDDGEPGIPNATVELLDGDGAVLDRTATDGDGLYAFRELPTGRYALRFVAPPGFVASPANVQSGPDGDDLDSDADPATGRTAVTELLPSEADLSWDAGFYRPAAVGDFVWHDLDRDGRQDSNETGLAGVDVALTWAGPDGAFNTVDDRIERTRSGAAGGYGFSDLAPGRYVLTFGFLPGHRFAPQGIGDDAKNSDADPANGRTRSFDLRSGDRNLDMDAGLVRLGPGIRIEKSPDLQQVVHGYSVSFVIVVANTGEVPLTDVTVSDPLSPTCDRVIGSLDVGATTSYTCTVENVRQDFVNNAGVTALDPIGGVVSDEDDAAVDVLPAISVEKSATPNAVRRTGEEVTFTVQVANRVSEALTLTRLVDDIHGDLDGQGTCSVPQTIAVGAVYTCNFTVVVLPGEAGETDTVTADAFDDENNRATADDSFTVRPLPGQSSIGDRVWYDVNANGIQDRGEAGVTNMRVQLYAADGTLIGETRTDGKGIYGFAGLDEGDYYLVFAADMIDAPFSDFSPQRENAASVDSDVRTVLTPSEYLTGRTDLFALARDTADLDRDAGLIVPLGIDDAEPTAIELERFTTMSDPESGIQVIWVTSAEVDTAGFELWRSTSVARAEAALITPQRIPSQGAQGGVYRFLDGSALPGVYYHYWLVEVEVDGDSSAYGPIRGRIEPTRSQFSVFLPLLGNR